MLTLLIPHLIRSSFTKNVDKDASPPTRPAINEEIKYKRYLPGIKKRLAILFPILPSEMPSK